MSSDIVDGTVCLSYVLGAHADSVPIVDHSLKLESDGVELFLARVTWISSDVDDESVLCRHVLIVAKMMIDRSVLHCWTWLLCRRCCIGIRRWSVDERATVVVIAPSTIHAGAFEHATHNVASCERRVDVFSAASLTAVVFELNASVCCGCDEHWDVVTA